MLLEKVQYIKLIISPLAENVFDISMIDIKYDAKTQNTW